MRKAMAIGLCGCFFLSSCDTLDGWAESSLGGQERAYFESYTASAEIQDRKIRDLEKSISETLVDLRDVRDVAAIQEGITRVQALQKQHEKEVAAYEDVSSRANRVLNESLAGKAGGLLAMLDPFVPVPLQPFIPVLSSVAVLVMSRRGREHAWKAVRHASMGNVGGLVGSIMRAVGAKHSNTDPAKIVGGAVKEARMQVINGELPNEKLEILEATLASLKGSGA